MRYGLRQEEIVANMFFLLAQGRRPLRIPFDPVALTPLHSPYGAAYNYLERQRTGESFTWQRQGITPAMDFCLGTIGALSTTNGAVLSHKEAYAELECGTPLQVLEGYSPSDRGSAAFQDLLAHAHLQWHTLFPARVHCTCALIPTWLFPDLENACCRGIARDLLPAEMLRCTLLEDGDLPGHVFAPYSGQSVFIVQPLDAQDSWVENILSVYRRLALRVPDPPLRLVVMQVSSSIFEMAAQRVAAAGIDIVCAGMWRR
jgi:hypothetical protein